MRSELFLNYGKYFRFKTEIIMIIFIQVRIEIRALIQLTRDPGSANSKVMFFLYVKNPYYKLLQVFLF